MKTFLCLIAMLLVPAAVTAQSAPEKYRVYVGTYTGGKTNPSKGIYQCELNMSDGKLSTPTLAGETKDPSFLAIHPNKKFLYAVNESQASVSAFAIDAATGNLKFLNSQPSKGGAPCHLIVDPSGKNVLAANYSGGSCICIRIGSDGELSNDWSFQQHEGKKKNGHSIHVDQANKFAFCCDLGLDKVMIYGFDPVKGVFKTHGAFDTPKGAGPRHFAWHPDGKRCYINGESDLTIIACDYDADKGALTQKQVLSTLPKTVTRKGGSTAETVVHPSGKFVYVSNRDPYNSIAIFSIDQKTFELTAVGHEAMRHQDAAQLRHRADGEVHAGRQPVGQQRDLIPDQSHDRRVDADWQQRGDQPAGVRALHGHGKVTGSSNSRMIARR